VNDRLRFYTLLTSQQDVIRKEGYFTSVPLPGNICLHYIYCTYYILHMYRHAYMYF